MFIIVMVPEQIGCTRWSDSGRVFGEVFHCDGDFEVHLQKVSALSYGNLLNPPLCGAVLPDEAVSIGRMGSIRRRERPVMNISNAKS